MNAKHSGDELCHIYEKMNFGKNRILMSLAEDWLREHQIIESFIDGSFYKPPNECSYIMVTSQINPNISLKVLEGTYCIEEALESSVRAQSKWGKENVQRRRELLYKISRALQSREELFSQLNGQKVHRNDFQLFCDYFNFYSDLEISNYENWKPEGVIVVILSYDTPLWVVGMEVAAALIAGCSVIVNPSQKAPFSSLLFAEICTFVGLPNGLLNIIPGSNLTSEELLSRNVSKIIFNGNHLEGNHLKVKFPFKNLSFFNTDHTASIILETSDVQSAVDKIFYETWNQNYQTSWGIYFIVVQESVSEVFIEKLTYKIKNFTHQTPIQPRFRDEFIRNNISVKLSEAKRMGAKVMENTTEEAWGPSVIIEYQPNSSDSDAPVINLLISRTAKEAVSLVNNWSYCLGTSIWTENLSQAMEVASQLISNVVWINCHGVTGPEVVLEPSRNSGSGCFGGIYGALDFMNWGISDSKEIYQIQKNEDEMGSTVLIPSEIIQSSHNSFTKWQFDEHRKTYLKNIFYSMTDIEELSEYGQLVNYWAHNTNSHDTVKSNSKHELYVMQSKKPIGIIAVVLTDSKDIIKSFISLVTPAIALGNVAVIVVPEELHVELEGIIRCFNKNLPRGVINIVKGIRSAYDLASNREIQALWLHSINSVTSAQIQKFRLCSFKHRKHFWITPSNLPTTKILFTKHCLVNQAIWFTKISHYP